eukprot:scaffold124226_cov51-Attheya_sp.AAC.2
MEACVSPYSPPVSVTLPPRLPPNRLGHSTQAEGVVEKYEHRLPFKDGPIDADGIPLFFVVGDGEILLLGPMLGLETGSNELDGCNEGLLNCLVLSVGAWLGLRVTDGCMVGKLLGPVIGSIVCVGC